MEISPERAISSAGSWDPPGGCAELLPSGTQALDPSHSSIILKTLSGEVGRTV